VHALAFKDNKHAVSASDDLSIRFWDLSSGKEIDQIDMGTSTDVPRCVAFDPATGALLVGTASWTILRFEVKKN
jgi:WD40 repeat protein